MGHRSQRQQVAQSQGMASSQAQIEVTTGRFYTGPIPEPQTLAEYERINPGLADRIIKMAEKEQGHRHKVENRRSWGQILLTLLAQFFGFIISVLAISYGAFLIYHDKPVGGLASLISGVVLLVGAFIFRRSRAIPQARQ